MASATSAVAAVAAAAAVTEKSNCGEAQSRCGRGFRLSGAGPYASVGRHSTWNSCLLASSCMFYTNVSANTRLRGLVPVKRSTRRWTTKSRPFAFFPRPPPSLIINPLTILFILFIYIYIYFFLSPLDPLAASPPRPPSSPPLDSYRVVERARRP